MRHWASSLTLSPSECPRKGELTLVDRTPAHLTCSGMKREWNINWSLAGGRGGQEGIADCGCYDYSCPPCHLDTDPSLYTLTRHYFSSTIQFRADIQTHDGATLTCSSSNHVSNRVSCRLRVVQQYKMPQCREGWLDLVEDEKVPLTVTCTQLTSDQSVTWGIANSTTGHIVATCPPCTKDPCFQQCDVHRDDFRVSRTATNTSLTVVRNVRALAGQNVACFLQKETLESCRISVLHNAQLSEPRVTMHSNWTVTGSVTFSEGFTSRGQIGCLWTRKSASGLVSSPHL
ncbi:uncharacterized protein LOC143277583 [Babylonia areolata]|uniref:uncharacterized protein LOC143277583 n=1 Tax=Babylonia areolata TaxID=304850 RepID=UPI003FD29AC8